MTRLFTFTISIDKKQSEFEGEQIIRVSWKCGQCMEKGTYTSNDYTSAFAEMQRNLDQKDDSFCCKCDCDENKLDVSKMVELLNK